MSNITDIQTCLDRMRIDIKTEANKRNKNINPYNDNDPINWILTAISGRFFEYKNYLEQNLIKNVYPTTADYDIVQDVWGKIKNIQPYEAKKSRGNVIFLGNGVILAGTKIKYNNILFSTENNILSYNMLYSIISAKQNNGIVTAIFENNHNMASGMKINITGAVEQLYNGEKTINIIDEKTINYNIDINAPAIATGNIKADVNYGFGSVICDEFGNNNLKNSEILQLTEYIDGIDENVYITYEGFLDGRDYESNIDYRKRVIKKYQNPQPIWSEDWVKTKVLEVPNITRCWVVKNFPQIGYCTIYAIKDNSIVKSLTLDDVQKIKNQFLEYESIFWNLNNLKIENLVINEINFIFSYIYPNTQGIKSSIQENLNDFFINNVDIGENITEVQYKNIIANAFDSTIGEKIIDYTLINPIGNINIDNNQLSSLGVIQYV